MKVRTVAAPEICQHTPENITGKCLPCKLPRTHYRRGIGGGSAFAGLKVLLQPAVWATFEAGELKFTVLGER